MLNTRQTNDLLTALAPALLNDQLAVDDEALHLVAAITGRPVDLPLLDDADKFAQEARLLDLLAEGQITPVEVDGRWSNSDHGWLEAITAQQERVDLARFSVLNPGCRPCKDCQRSSANIAPAEGSALYCATHASARAAHDLALRGVPA